MKKIKLLYLLTLIIFASTSCKKDNYKEPDAAVKGSIIDNITKKPIQTELSGIMIRFWQQGKYEGVLNNQLTDFFVKNDGTFEQTKLFSGVYKVRPQDGPFLPLTDTQTVNIQNTTEINFTVTPYVVIAATVTPSGAGSVTVKYRISKGVPAAKIQEARAFASLSPYVSVPVSEKSVTRTLTAIPDATIEATDYTEVLSGLPSGQTFYVRAAARTASNTRYNYSEIFKVVIP